MRINRSGWDGTAGEAVSAPSGDGAERHPVYTTLVLLTVFSTGFMTKGAAFDFYWFYAALPLLLLAGLYLAGGVLSLGIAGALGAVAAHTALTAALFGHPLGGALSQIVGLTAMLSLFYMTLRANAFDTGYVLTIYVRIAFWICVVALFQAGSFVAGFETGYDLGWLIPWYRTDLSELGALRVRSILPEPAVFGAVIAPALLIAVGNMTQRRRVAIGWFRSLVIVAAAALTFSAVTYAALALSLLLVALRRRSGARPFWIAGGLLLATAAYVYLPDIRLRVDDLLALYNSENMAGANFSSLALHNNAIVGWKHLAATGFIGGGIGSHPIAFERYSLLFGHSEIPILQLYLNAGDAASLFLRIMSELGIPGLLAFFVFLVRFQAPAEDMDAVRRNGSASAMPSNRMVSDAALVFLAVALLRSGHYFAYGLPLFLLLYCYAHVGIRAALPAEGGAAALGGAVRIGSAGTDPIRAGT